MSNYFLLNIHTPQCCEPPQIFTTVFVKRDIGDTAQWKQFNSAFGHVAPVHKCVGEQIDRTAVMQKYRLF